MGEAGELVRLGVDVATGVATITLDSPHNRNALSRQLVTELLDRLERAAADEAVRVVVLRSTDRVFCSGADLAEAGAGGSDAMAEGTRALVAVQRAIVAHPKPVVCRLAGPVRAGGLGLVAASDVVVCGDDVTFALTEVRLALAPAVISLTLLPRLASRAAADVFLTGRSFTAAEAVSMGLVTRAVAPADLDAEVEAVCADLAQGAPQGLRETKALLGAPLLAHIDAHADEVAALSARLFSSPEAAEAMTAFLTRRR